MEGSLRAAEMGGRMMGGRFLFLGMLIFLLIFVVIRMIVHRRRMKAWLSGNYEGKGPLPPFMRAEMSKERAARIVIASLKKEGVAEADIRSKLLAEYQLEPLIADALLIEVNLKG